MRETIWGLEGDKACFPPGTCFYKTWEKRDGRIVITPEGDWVEREIINNCAQELIDKHDNVKVAPSGLWVIVNDPEEVKKVLEFLNDKKYGR